MLPSLFQFLSASLYFSKRGAFCQITLTSCLPKFESTQSVQIFTTTDKKFSQIVSEHL